MRYASKTVLSDVDTGSVTGGQIDTNQVISASFQIVFGDATAAGTFKIQASNDIDTSPGTFLAANWVDIPNATASITSGAQAIITINQCAYRWLRAVYTRASGGSTTVVVNMFALSV